MAVACEGEFDAAMHQALAVGAAARTGFIEQCHCALFQEAGPDASEHIIRRLPFQDDVVDSIGVKQLSEQQSRRPCANDCYFCPQYLPP